jgi:hypothetical protein
MNGDNFIPFYGGYEYKYPYRIWHHNPCLHMTEDDQYEWNLKHHSDFSVFKKSDLTHDQVYGRITYRKIKRKTFIERLTDWMKGTSS